MVLNECWDVKPPRADEQTLPPLTQLLPFVRQLLTCCACAGLLEDAMISTSCGHCYCAKCQLGTPLLKIQCRQCKERTGLVPENQIRLVVKCYCHMCHVLAEYLTATPSAPLQSGEFNLAKGRETPEGFNPVTEILAEVVNGVKVSRTVLLVLPPPKYLNPKPPPDPPTPRKDPNIAGGSHHNDPTSPIEDLTEGNTRTSAEESTLTLHGEDAPANFTDAPTKVIQLASTASRSHKRKSRREKRVRLRLTPTSKHRRKRQLTLRGAPVLKPKKGKDTTNSGRFHNTVDFMTARPKSGPLGEMKIFISMKLHRLRQGCLCGLGANSDVQVHEDCLDKHIVFVSGSSYKVRQDLPSTSLLPPPFHPQISSLQVPLLSSKPNTNLGGKTNTHQVLERSHSTLTPWARFKSLRPKYRSPYLHSHDTPHKTKNPQPSEMNAPQITLTPCDSGGPSPGENPPIKKTKRSPRTPGHWRCRCGTNNPQTLDRICARGKCPCFVKNIPCNNCLCRHCKNPFNKSPQM